MISKHLSRLPFRGNQLCQREVFFFLRKLSFYDSNISNDHTILYIHPQRGNLYDDPQERLENTKLRLPHIKFLK